MKPTTDKPASTAWIIVGGLFALALGALFVREIPAVRRELRLTRM